MNNARQGSNTMSVRLAHVSGTVGFHGNIREREQIPFYLKDRQMKSTNLAKVPKSFT